MEFEVRGQRKVKKWGMVRDDISKEEEWRADEATRVKIEEEERLLMKKFEESYTNELSREEAKLSSIRRMGTPSLNQCISSTSGPGYSSPLIFSPQRWSQYISAYLNKLRNRFQYIQRSWN